MSKKEKSVGRLSRAFSLSIIVNLIDRFTNAVYNSLIRGLFGRIFTAYSAEETAFEGGFVRNYFKEIFRLGSGSRRVRAKLSRAFETSFLLGKLCDFSRELLATSLKLYGNFLLSFGLYSILIYFVCGLVPSLEVPEVSFLIVSISAVLASLPLLVSRVSLGRALGYGRITRLIFIEAFGFKNEDFEIPVKKSKRKANFAILVGMIFGLLTFFVHPIYFALALIFVVFAAMVVVSPEIGVLATIFLIPFCSFFENPSLALAIFVIISTVGYLIKLIRGKRIFKVEILDLAIIIFTVVIFMGGIISAGGAGSRSAALISCVLILGYFLVVNLMRTEKWINRCVGALVSSSVIVAAIGVLQYILGYSIDAWLDKDYFSDISGRVVSVFDNPNVLAVYLVLAFPLLLGKISSATTRKGRLLGFISAATVVACLVFTWSRAAWLAVIISVILMGLINHRKTFKVLLVSGFAVPFLPFVLPASVVKRFTSIGNLSDSSSYYRVYTWRGSLRAAKDYFWGGAGYGSSAYAEVYPKYAYAGIEAAEHSHNLFVQILFGLGIFGLLIFFAVIFLFAQKNFEHFKNSQDKGLKLMASAAFCAVVGALIVGMFDYIWYNFRIFFMFWIVMALGCAYIRFATNETERKSINSDYGPESASIDL
ncbi:MAG: O-antigen ligase family protein [Clostridia bacterium]|nr:O-antigen ligase family protein [Clostridia bacterium]